MSSDIVDYLAVQCEGGYPLCDDAIAAGAMLREQAAEITRLRALSAQPAAVPGWEPIETAPKDGSKVLLNWKSGVVVGWYEKRTVNTHLSPWRRDLFGLRDTCYGAEPTHWMPLPAAPQAPQQDNSHSS